MGRKKKKKKKRWFRLLQLYELELWDHHGDRCVSGKLSGGLNVPVKLGGVSRVEALAAALGTRHLAAPGVHGCY